MQNARKKRLHMLVHFVTIAAMDKQLIKNLGGPSALSRKLNLSVATVASWSRRRIPDRYRPTIAAIAAKRGINLPPDFFKIIEVTP